MDEIVNRNFWQQLFGNLKIWIIDELPGLIIALLLFFVATRLLNFFIKKLKKGLIRHTERHGKQDRDEAGKRIETLTSIIHGLIKIILWIVLLMVVLQKFNINIAPMLAGAGIVGLALGFGAQGLVRDFISGFFIILENQIRAGDVAIIDGTAGLVEKIAFRTTILRDFSGTVHIFQNGKISNIANMTKDWSAMVFDIGVAYKEDPQKVMELMKQVGDEMYKDSEFKDKILQPIEVFGLDKFADSALIIKARMKTKPIQQWSIGREYRKRLKKVFDENNIEIPFPHTTVYWGDKIDPLKLELNNQILDKIE